MRARVPWFVPVALLLVPVIGGCGGSIPKKTPPLNSGCLPAEHDKFKPVVCVDDTHAKLVILPDTVEAFDETPGGATVPIIFRTKSGRGDLKIIPKTSECVEKPVCVGNGMCIAVVKKLGEKETRRTCQYDVTLGEKDLDPTIQVDQCCN